MSSETAFEVGRLFAQLKRIADVMTASQNDVFVRLPALVGYWTGGARDMNGDASDHSSAGYRLTKVGTSYVGYDGNAYTVMGPSAEYMYNTSVGGIWGFENWVEVASRGLTVGGWFKMAALPSGGGGLVSKDGITSNRGWALFQQSTGEAAFSLSFSGGTPVSVVGGSLGTGEWKFLCARWIPGTELAVWVDTQKSTNATAIPAGANISTQRFEIGRFFNADSAISDGKWRDVFLCAARLPDDLIEEVRAASVP